MKALRQVSVCVVNRFEVTEGGASLVVKTGGDPEDLGRAFVRRDDGSQATQLFVVSKVFDPVGAAGRRRRDVPLHSGLALLVHTLQPVEPAVTYCLVL